jgi:hypothetical protein
MSGGKSIFDQLRSLFGKSKEAKKPAPSTKSEAQEKPVVRAEAGSPAHSPPTPKREVAPIIPKSPPPTLTAPSSRIAEKPPAPARTQVNAAPEVDLVLGIDLGTSCSKVVIGDHGWLGQSYAVPIGNGGSGLERFLRPTRIDIGHRMETNLKMRLMANPGFDEVRAFVALYLAGVIRDSLQWFSSQGSRRYADRKLVWSLNLGFPAKQIEDGPLVSAYKHIANLAARLGGSDLPLNLAALESLRDNPERDSSRCLISSSRIVMYPEIAAQLAGYVNSPYRAQGNLILVDVGAGTLDVSTAILHGNDDEDVVSFHFCEVGPYGAMKLLEARMEALEKVQAGAVRIRLDDFQSGTTPTPESPGAILGRREPVSQKFSKAFTDVSDEFADKAIGLGLSCATRFRRLQRDVHANTAFDPWPGYVRFFFTGGGSRLGFYRKQFIQGPFEQKLTRFTRWRETPRDRQMNQQGLLLEPLPVPPDLQGLPDEIAGEFDRLSVAHGLAYGSQNLMKITASVHS